jgi:hypothetical protein
VRTLQALQPCAPLAAVLGTAFRCPPSPPRMRSERSTVCGGGRRRDGLPRPRGRSPPLSPPRAARVGSTLRPAPGPRAAPSRDGVERRTCRAWRPMCTESALTRSSSRRRAGAAASAATVLALGQGVTPGGCQGRHRRGAPPAAARAAAAALLLAPSPPLNLRRYNLVKQLLAGGVVGRCRLNRWNPR